MGRFSAHLFSRLHQASFYRELHEQAVALPPAGNGAGGEARWLDVGCGPGLVCHLAARRGYRVTGLDRDPAMIQAAAQGRLWPEQGPERGPELGPELGPKSRQPENRQIDFRVSGLDDLGRMQEKFQVVSATSLLAVLPDRPAALRRLLSGLDRDGTLLLVEPDHKMGLQTALHCLWQRYRHHRTGRGELFLLLWAITRTKGRAVDAGLLIEAGCAVTRVPLLDGLVNAWLVRP